MKLNSSIKIYLLVFILINIIPPSICATGNNENEIEQKIKGFIRELFIDIRNKDINNIIDKYHTDGISSSEFGERSKLEIENALKNSDAPITQFMFGEPKASYYQNCKNSQDKIYTTPKHFYELYGNNYEVEIFFRGLDKRNLPEYHIEISGKTTNLKEQKCSFKLPSLYVVIENEKVYLVSLIYIYRKGLPGVQ